MKAQLILLSIFIATTFFVGCEPTEPKAKSTPLSYGSFNVGDSVHDISLVEMNGKHSTFNNIRQPVAVVVFSEPPGTECCWLNPDLVRLADRFKNYSISVAQISLPTSHCSHGPGCTATCIVNNAHLIAICDKDKIAWNTYRQPPANAIFLIDGKSKIISISSLDNLNSVADKATDVATQYEAKPKDFY